MKLCCSLTLKKWPRWIITWLQAMHNTAMAGESTWLSWVRKNAGPKNPIDCMICQTWKYIWHNGKKILQYAWEKEISSGHWMKFHHPECIVITNFFIIQFQFDGSMWSVKFRICLKSSAQFYEVEDKGALYLPNSCHRYSSTDKCVCNPTTNICRNCHREPGKNADKAGLH